MKIFIWFSPHLRKCIKYLATRLRHTNIVFKHTFVNGAVVCLSTVTFKFVNTIFLDADFKTAGRPQIVSFSGIFLDLCLKMCKLPFLLSSCAERKP